MEMCQRCLSKPVSFQCTTCTSYKNLCTRCDNILHSLASKQNHRRIAFSPKNLNEEEPNNINTNNTMLNPNIEMDNDLIANKKPNEVRMSLDTNDLLNNNNLVLSQINKCESNENYIVPNQCNSLMNNSVLNTNLLIADNYSKDYVNEIKKIFKKEKEVLEYKNKTLQYSLDKIKVDFSEHINNLTKQLEEAQNNNAINLDVIKKNYENKIFELNKKHEVEITSLKEDINHLVSEINEIKENYNNEFDKKEKLISQQKNELDNLNQDLKSKSDELFKIKNSFDILTTQYENNYTAEKNKIISEYENKISQIVKNVEESKNNLVNLIDQREFDMKNIIDMKNKEIFELKKVNDEMKTELDSHKVNLGNLRKNADSLIQENLKLKNELHKLNCDTELQVNEIERIQNENQLLADENDRLKIELNKLDNIIYGNNCEQNISHNDTVYT